MELDDQEFETLAVHVGRHGTRPEGSVVFPIFQGTVYESEPGESYDEIKYLRLSTTPSQQDLQDRLAALEGADSALATASGMAAVSAALLSVLKAGDHLLANDVLYGGTHGLLSRFADRLGWTYTLVDAGRPESWSPAVRPETKAFLVESMTNPLIRVGDLRGVAEFARQHGLVSIIDNTFATPVNFRPLGLGYDLVVHSATKYLGGHSDLVAGCVAGNAERVGTVRSVQNHFGGSLDPHAGFLLARGLKTLAIRVSAQNANAQALAEFLAGHQAVAAVNYPGLPSHPDHDRAAELFHGFGGMLSFRLGGGLDAAEHFLKALRIPYVAPSLGGVETLVTRPAATSHAGMSPSARAEIGVTDDLVRVSCGIESARDLVADFDQALGAG
ncbi:MAG TPA: PLP-dependent transferase [Jiangellales bacterium]|nr:PLP-dependent transferase [Jiangellales bacterium]